MPTLPVGDLLRALVPTNWKWVRLLLEAVKGTKIKKGDLEILLENRPSIGDDVNTVLDKPHEPGPSRGRQG